MGIGTKIKIGVALAVIIFGVGAGLYIKSLRAQNSLLAYKAQTLSAQVEALQGQVKGCKQELANNYKALQEREEKIAELSNQTGILYKELKDLYETSEPCATWATSCIPDPVLNKLR